MSAAYRQRDGKTVTIGANGAATRVLASGEADPEPLAGLDRDGNPTRLDQRIWDELGRRFLDEAPLAADHIAFARPSPENLAAFNRSRAEWQAAMYAFAAALEYKHKDVEADALAEMLCAAGGYDLDLSAFVEEHRQEDPRLQALIDAVNEASGWLGAAVANIAESA